MRTRRAKYTAIVTLCFAALSAVAKDYEAVPPGVSVVEVEGTVALINDFGRPFYVYDKDEKDKSNCVAACTDTWAPMPAYKNAQPMPNWTLVPRSEGYRQWAYKGRPIYISNTIYSSITEVLHGKAALPKDWHILVP